MPVLRATGVILFLFLAGWIGWTATHYDRLRPTPEILGVGSAFEGDAQLPAQEMRATVDEARVRVAALNRQGRYLGVGADACTWLSFACTAAITLIAGWLGRSLPQGGGTPDTKGLAPGATRAIGLLAALAAILTAGGGLAADRGHKDFDAATSAQAMVNRSVKDIEDAKTPNDARAVLDNLKLKVGQL